MLTEEDVQQQSALEQAVDDAREDAEMVDKRKGAIEAHENALNYGLIKAALGPKGIRSIAMQEEIGELHKLLLHRISKLTGWPKSKLDAAYNVLVDGYYAQVTAGSWRWRANVMLQAAIAVLTEEKYVIADAADLLDHKGGVTGLVSLCEWLVGQGISPIVCATDTIQGLPSDWQVVKIT